MWTHEGEDSTEYRGRLLRRIEELETEQKRNYDIINGQTEELAGVSTRIKELEAENNQLASRLGSVDAKLDQSVYVVADLLSRLRQRGLKAKLAAASEAFAEKDIKRHNRIKELEAELALKEKQADAYEEKIETGFYRLKADNARLRECLKRSELICGNCGKLAERHNEAVHLRDVISALEHEIVAKDARIRELEDSLVMEQTLHALDHAAVDALKAQVDREAK